LGLALCCPQPVWSRLMFMRKPTQDHPPGWLLSFFPCLEQFQGGEEHSADDGMQ
jgi:hypothetical protein